MDWLVAPATSENARALGAMLTDQLRRRAATPDAVDAAAGPAEALLAADPGSSALWVRLDWERPYPTLIIRSRHAPVDDGWLGAGVAGVVPADRATAELEELFADGTTREAVLPVARGATVDIDLAPERVGPKDASVYPGSVAAILAGEVEAGLTQEEAAVIAGATAATTAAGQWSAGHDGAGPVTATDVAAAFRTFVNQAGADFYLVEGDERRAVLANRACPFAPAEAHQSVLCRTTSALLGSLAARAHGSATVTVDETIAGGDRRCRVVLDLDGTPSRWNHAYSWPPAGPLGGSRGLLTRGFRIAISLQLPRDQLSVPLIRHTVANTLREVGAVPEDVHAVETAVSEATGNVIRHAGEGDAYDVEVTIGPELAELRVIDIGRGFDSEGIAAAGDDPDAEHGRGMALMQALVDQARFASAPERGTIVHLVKRLRFDEDAPARRLMLSELAREDDRNPTPADRGGQGSTPAPHAAGAD